LLLGDPRRQIAAFSLLQTPFMRHGGGTPLNQARFEGEGLANRRPVGAVILEYSPDLSRAGGLSAADMVDAFVAAGFAPFALDEQSRLKAIAVDTLRGLAGQMDLVLMRKG
jgi:hypothetical protein